MKYWNFTTSQWVELSSVPYTDKDQPNSAQYRKEVCGNDDDSGKITTYVGFILGFDSTTMKYSVYAFTHWYSNVTVGGTGTLTINTTVYKNISGTQTQVGSGSYSGTQGYSKGSESSTSSGIDSKGKICEFDYIAVESELSLSVYMYFKVEGTWGGLDRKHSNSATVTITIEPEESGLAHIDNGTAFESCTCHIDNGTSWDQYIPYIDNGTSWEMCS